MTTVHPYSVRLENLLREMHNGSGSKHVKVVEKGCGGEWVVRGMKLRLKQILMADKTNNEMEPYHFIAVLGGINDILNGGVRVEYIFKSGLDRMYRDVLSHGSRLVAVTLPPYDLMRFKDRLQGDEERREDMWREMGGEEGRR